MTSHLFITKKKNSSNTITDAGINGRRNVERNSNKKRKWSAEFSVYSKKILMPNTILTLMYNIVKVKRSNTLNKIQTMSVCTINSPELPVLF